MRPGGEEELDCGFCSRPSRAREEFCGGSRRAAPFGVACWRLTLRGLVFDAVVTAGVMDGDELVDERSPYRKLHDAAAAGNITQMRRALAEGADPNMIDESHSALSPLHVAAVCCKPEAVATLLLFRARVDIETVEGSTPIMLALVLDQGPERDRRLIVNDLISAGASVHARSHVCLLYTSPSPRDGLLSRMPSSA